MISGYNCYTIAFGKVWTQVLSRFKSYSRRVRSLQYWEPSTMAPDGNMTSQPAMFEVSNRNTRTRCELCLNLIIKTPEWRVVKIVAVEEILKHSILDIELNKENLFPCVLLGFTTKQNVIREGRYCKIQKISTRSKNFYFISLKWLKSFMSVLKLKVLNSWTSPSKYRTTSKFGRNKSPLSASPSFDARC